MTAAHSGRGSGQERLGEQAVGSEHFPFSDLWD